MDTKNTNTITSVNGTDRRIWTHDDRQKWIEQAVASDSQGGRCDGYTFSVLPKLDCSSQPNPQDEDVSKATETHADVIYRKDKRFRPIGLGFYVMLLEKIKNNSFIGQYLWRKIIVMIKGSTAHSLLLPDMNLSCSDLDIVIFIDPYCDPHTFNDIKRSLNIIMLQTLSQYKKTLDNMFFLDTPNANVQPLWGMQQNVIDEFKKTHIVDMEQKGFISPFASKESRNKCSRNSIVLFDSKVQTNSVVKVEVPHFNCCEKIPLKHTPIFCSYNETIHNEERNFSLYRMKMNCLSASTNHRVPIDFIDITILSQNDIELLDFWNHARFVSLYDKFTDIWVAVSDLPSCIHDLWKMLNVYDCPAHKKEKRQQKYDMLLKLYTEPPAISIPHALANP
jgi:hypothetical protein